MSVLPPDLPRLQKLVTHLRGKLSRAERALTAAEAAEALGPAPAPAGAARMAGRARDRHRPARLHPGNCSDTGNRCAPATPEQIRQLLTQGVPACIYCRPDTTLGVFE